MINSDNVTALERMRPHRRRGYPWILAVIAFVLLAYGITDAITRWGESAPLLSWTIRSCGL